MNITRLETIHLGRHPDSLWLRIHTDAGLTGLGETSYAPRAVSALIHDQLAPLLLEQDSLDIERHWQTMFAAVNAYGFGGAETRAISAVDIALWDIAGQYIGQPIYNLLGGRSRDRIPIYNTCLSHGANQDARIWMEGRAGQLAADLLRQGINAMKIWPFDLPPGPARAETGAPGPVRHYLDKDTLKRGVACVEEIRAAVGDKMQIAIEGNARWNLPAAIEIARALEPYNIMWLEEMIPPDNVESYARLKAESRIPLCVSERLFTRFGFRRVVEAGAADIIMPDISWTGGITETRKICAHADTYYLPVTGHDATGPVALWAAAHLMLHVPNAMNLETVRAYYNGWYNDIVTERIPINAGMLSLPEKPGLGVALRQNVFSRPDARIETRASAD